MEENFKKWLSSQSNPHEILNFIRHEFKTEQELELENLAEQARENFFPLQASQILENSTPIDRSQSSGVNPTLEVDSFLYPDEVLDEDPEFSRNYCPESGNKFTKPFEFISHSFSVEELTYLFENLTTNQEILTIFKNCIKYIKLLDIGCRFGIVSKTAAIFQIPDTNISGIELDENMQKIHTSLNIPGQFIHGDIVQNLNLLESHNLFVMNNVFEYFVDQPSTEIKIWVEIYQKFETLRKNSEPKILVTVPSLEQTFERLFEVEFDLGSIVRGNMPKNNSDSEIKKI